MFYNHGGIIMGILEKAPKISLKELESAGVITQIKKQVSDLNKGKKQI